MKSVMALDVKNIISLFTFFVVLIGCSDISTDRIEKITGSRLPHNIITVDDIEKWIEPTGNGYKIKVFEMKEGDSWINYEACNSHGLEVGKYEDINLSVEQATSYIDTSSKLCYKVLQSPKKLELVILQGKVIFYFFNDF